MYMAKSLRSTIIRAIAQLIGLSVSKSVFYSSNFFQRGRASRHRFPDRAGEPVN
jgi:hypothetical protein